MHEQMSKKQFLTDICSWKKNKRYFLVIHTFHVSKHSQKYLYDCGRNSFSLKFNQFLKLQVPCKETTLGALM